MKRKRELHQNALIFMQYSCFWMENNANIFTYYQSSDFSKQNVVFNFEILLENPLEIRI